MEERNIKRNIRKFFVNVAAIMVIISSLIATAVSAFVIIDLAAENKHLNNKLPFIEKLKYRYFPPRHPCGCSPTFMFPLPL